MKQKRYFEIGLVIFLLVVATGKLWAQTTPVSEFTYQGYLEQNDKPIDEPCNFKFRLYTAESGGVQLGEEKVRNGVGVNGGLFTVNLDFGNDVFTSTPPWLEIDVYCGQGNGSYTTLSPRVELTPAPWALSLPGLFSDGIGRIGIGTINPTAPLHVYESADVGGHTVRVDAAANANPNVQFLVEGQSAANIRVNDSGANQLQFQVYESFGGPSITAMSINPSGNVGINTASPLYQLDVNGSLRTTNGILKTNANGETRVFISSSSVSDRGYIDTQGPNGNINIILTSFAGYPNHGFVGVVGEENKFEDGVLIADAGIYVNSEGEGVIFGDIKSFRITNPNQPETDIWYASLEGPEAAAYIRGTAQLVNGQATITLPDHFLAVASPEGLTVQITPLSAQSNGLAVVQKSLDGIVVQELRGGTGTYDFDFLIMAVRQGYEDYQVIRSTIERAAAAEVQAEAEHLPTDDNETENAPGE